jgi:hypothetical protein
MIMAHPSRSERSTEETDFVTVSGWPVEKYAHIVKWPSLVVIVLDIIVVTANWNLSLSWLFLIILTVFLGGVTARIYHGTVGNAAGLGFAAGLIIGVSSSLFRFLWFHTLTAFFQIITISLLSILVSLLMSTSAYLVLVRERRSPRTPSSNRPHH